eukprot:41984_1
MDDKVRYLWNVGSEIEIYSKSKNKWYKGEIIKIINDSEGEWLKIRYNNYKSKKEIQRFSKLLRSREEFNINMYINKCKIANFDNYFSKMYRLKKVINRGGQGAIWSTKCKNKNDSNNIDIITKMYQLDIESSDSKYIEQINKIKEEYIIFNQLKLIDYRNTLPSFSSFSKIKKKINNKNQQILIPMEKLSYSLHDYILNENKFNTLDLKYLILEIAGCIHRLHSIGYAHFDVQPCNIMYNNNTNNNNNIYYGEGWKIIDGGLIDQINFDIGSKQMYGYKGVIGYTSPEMIIDKYNITKKSDVWSFGVVILFALNILNDTFKPRLCSVFAPEYNQLKEKK